MLLNVVQVTLTDKGFLFPTNRKQQIANELPLNRLCKTTHTGTGMEVKFILSPIDGSKYPY
jgi:hypothetical protein